MWFATLLNAYFWVKSKNHLHTSKVCLLSFKFITFYNILCRPEWISKINTTTANYFISGHVVCM